MRDSRREQITNGILFPHGQLWREDDSSPEDGFIRIAGLLKMGYAARKEIFPKALTVCHLEHSATRELQENYFVNLPVTIFLSAYAL